MPRLLCVEPYFAGSHQQWLEGLKKHLAPFGWEIDFLTLPGHHWKWRMELGAVELLSQISSVLRPDLMLCSSMLDLPTFLVGLPWKKPPTALYFHENQFAYPFSENDKEAQRGIDYHYPILQYKSALCADQIFFNSHYNKDSFFGGLHQFFQKGPSKSSHFFCPELLKKSRVLPLGLELPLLPQRAATQHTSQVLVWNHRWERDKNPELFFHTLFQLDKEEIPFQLIVLGEHFKHSPPIFSEAKKRLSGRTLHWGYAPTRTDYWQLLAQGDILPITSNQDFFGISFCEGLHAGLKPLYPNRLAFPEHFNTPKKTFHSYESPAEFYQKLKQFLLTECLETNPIHKVASYAWEHKAREYHKKLLELLK